MPVLEKKKVSKISAFAQSLACTRPPGTARNASFKVRREALRGAARVYADTKENQMVLEKKAIPHVIRSSQI